MYGYLAKFGVAFTPEAVKVLTAAFDDAWAHLEASGAPYSAVEYAEAVRTHLAKSILGAAQRGEWDQNKLCDEALLYLSQQRLSRVPPKTVLPWTNYDARRADLYLTVLAVAAIGFVVLLLYLR